MFEAIGVGDDKATAYGATLTWLIKGHPNSFFIKQKNLISNYFLTDGTGMAGKIVFAWYQGSWLDSNSKMWRYDLALLFIILIGINFMINLIDYTLIFSMIFRFLSTC